MLFAEGPDVLEGAKEDDLRGSDLWFCRGSDLCGSEALVFPVALVFADL